MSALASIAVLTDELLVRIGTWLGVQLCVDRAEQLGRVSTRWLVAFRAFVRLHRMKLYAHELYLTD